MKKSIGFFLMALLIGVAFSCKQEEKHFITDETYRDKVESDFESVRNMAASRSAQLFGVFNEKLTTEEAEALKFLYAYMPLNDLADYDGGFFLKNVRLAFAARDTFKWGREIPEDVFRHFVLPYRVNNENLDSARSVFFHELYPRIKDLSIEQAALEVNHWCHEKVNYHPSDSRTSAPLSTVRTAWGRCGEESTFAVTALRSVGIPARQVYTPRWAHVDDNHAWVEVYINGAWKYMGACEPEPALNIGWFTAPALRAMMMHTNAFGNYSGSEKVLNRYDKYAKLNLLENYAPAKELVVKVVSPEGAPVEGAAVEFGLYNYAEFYPLQKQTTKADGLASLLTGYGDIQVLASDKQGRFNLEKVTVETQDTFILVLSHRVGDSFKKSFENVPPVAKPAPDVNPEGAEANKIRFAREDSIREAYISTFITREKAEALAGELLLDKDRVWNVLEASRGNWSEIQSYLKKAVTINKNAALNLLEEIAPKDLRDTPSDILLDHLSRFTQLNSNPELSDMEKKYVLNPRAELEMIRPYRSFLQDSLMKLKQATAEQTVAKLTEWINQKIVIDTVNNYYNIAISPIGVFQLKRSDAFSRDLFFVAACRSLNIPARIEPATKVPQYYNGQWLNVGFGAAVENQVQPEKAWVKLQAPKGKMHEPLYYIHFTLARFKNNRFETLDYDWETPLSKLPEKLELEPGYYQLLTGNRMADGSVLVHEEYFELRKGEELTKQLIINEQAGKPKVIASWKGSVAPGPGACVVGWINPATEPGNHFLNEFGPVKPAFEAGGVSLTIYVQNKEDIEKIKGRLPQNTVFRIDEGWNLLGSFAAETKLAGKENLPVFIVLQNKSEVIAHIAGYSIGTGEQLLKCISRAK